MIQRDRHAHTYTLDSCRLKSNLWLEKMGNKTVECLGDLRMLGRIFEQCNVG